jgi:bacteriocin-like protein
MDNKKPEKKPVRPLKTLTVDDLKQVVGGLEIIAEYEKKKKGYGEY